MTGTQIGARELRKVLWLMMLVALAAPAALGQFGGLKKKLSTIGGTTPGAAKAPQPPQGPMPAVATITPNSVPPGWEGQVVFTGSNFSKDMKLRLTCDNQTMKVKGFTVESAERAYFGLKVPPDFEETKCVMGIEVLPAATAETAPTPQGSLQVVQVTGPSFSISKSSPLAMAFRACFMMEGDVPVMQLMGGLSQAMGSQDECKLMVASDSVKYTASKGKVILDAPGSAVKDVERILMMGNPSGIFRIILKSGKIYNFFNPEGGGEDDPMTDQIKSKLKM